MHLEEGGRKVVGRGASTDVIGASGEAYIDGLNKFPFYEAFFLRVYWCQERTSDCCLRHTN